MQITWKVVGPQCPWKIVIRYRKEFNESQSSNPNILTFSYEKNMESCSVYFESNGFKMPLHGWSKVQLEASTG